MWIKAMSFSSAVKTPSASTWISIFWLISTVRIAVCQVVQVQTSSSVAAQCGQNVRLTCDVNSSQKLDIKLFSWLNKNGSVCEHKHKFRCENTKKDMFNHRLTLTIFNLMPNDAGKYTCKLRSAQGTGSNNTMITVQECRGNSIPFMNESHAACSFHGVFPRGVVHWFQGDANLTESIRTEEEVDQHGLYKISSTFRTRGGKLSQPYNCSLWMPSLTKYHSWKLLEVKSTGSGVRLQWSCAVMASIMVLFALRL